MFLFARNRRELMLIYLSRTERADDVPYFLGDAYMPVFRSLTSFGTGIAFGCQMMLA